VTSRLITLSIDANDPQRLAEFYAALLDWDIDPESDDDELCLTPNDGTSYELLFLRVPEPKTSQNRIHLDITTTSLDDQNDTVARLLELGGTRLHWEGPEDDHIVLADPEGNELCIIGPGNNFLANTGRIGAINCDGLAATGYFWSEALGWPLVWDQDGETAIQAPGGQGTKITWSGPPLLPKPGKNRLHLDIAQHAGEDQQAEVERLLSLGATTVDIGQGEQTWVVMADPDGNEFCLLRPR
jgi:predicted enzyme related to lactoylglutathione lyase/catechol 2,3-dioxygenase-like lactoylglutathione lyase family enzyme